MAPINIVEQMLEKTVAACEDLAIAHENAAKMVRQRALAINARDFALNHLSAHLYNKEVGSVDVRAQMLQQASEEWLRAELIARENTKLITRDDSEIAPSK